jgi:hypothetical protein
MSKRKRGRGNDRIIPTAAALVALRQDYPKRVRQQLFLLAHGRAHAGKRRCLICGAPARFGELWIPHEALTPVPGEGRPQSYWCCRQHHETPVPDDELVKLLAARRRESQR